MSPGSKTSTRVGRALELGGEHARNVFERGLRRAVAAPRGIRFDARVRRNVDDRARFGPRHQRQRVLDQVNRREDVDVEERAEGLAIERSMRRQRRLCRASRRC